MWQLFANSIKLHGLQLVLYMISCHFDRSIVPLCGMVGHVLCFFVGCIV